MLILTQLANIVLVSQFFDESCFFVCRRIDGNQQIMERFNMLECCRLVGGAKPPGMTTMRRGGAANGRDCSFLVNNATLLIGGINNG